MGMAQIEENLIPINDETEDEDTANSGSEASDNGSNGISTVKMAKILDVKSMLTETPVIKKHNVSRSVQLKPFTEKELASPSDDDDEDEEEMKCPKLTMSDDDGSDYIVSSDPSDEDDGDCLEQ